MEEKDAKNLKETIEGVLPKLKKALGISTDISNQYGIYKSSLKIYIDKSTEKLRDKVNISPSLQHLLQQVIITPVVRKQTYDKEDIENTINLRTDEPLIEPKLIADKITELLKSPFEESSYTKNRADLFPSEVFASYYKTPQAGYYYDFQDMVKNGHGNPVAAIAAHYFTSEFLGGKKLIDQNERGTAGILDAGAVIYGLVADHLLKSRIVSVYPKSNKKSSVLAETRANLIGASYSDEPGEGVINEVVPYYIGMRQLIETYGNAKHREKDIKNLHTDMKVLLPTNALDGKSNTFNYDDLYDKYSAALISVKERSIDFESKLNLITALKDEAKYRENTVIMQFIVSLDNMIKELGTPNQDDALETFLEMALKLIKSCVVKDEKFDEFFLSLSSSITDKGEEMVVEEGALALETTPKIEEKQPSLPWIMHGCGHDDMFQDHSLMETSARIWNEDVMVV
jgi:hypothetical protein